MQDDTELIHIGEFKITYYLNKEGLPVIQVHPPGCGEIPVYMQMAMVEYARICVADHARAHVEGES